MSIMEEFGEHYCQACGTDCIEAEDQIARLNGRLAAKDEQIRVLRDLCREISEDAGLADVIAGVGEQPEWWPTLLREAVALSSAPEVRSEEDAKQDILLGDMSMLIRMMVTKHRRGKLDEEYCQKALDFLQRKGLQGNVLRAQIDSAPEGEKQPQCGEAEAQARLSELRELRGMR